MLGVSPYHLLMVSTHSRAEAAALLPVFASVTFIGFNTQPRGGGCPRRKDRLSRLIVVSTHSRAEAAAVDYESFILALEVSTHSRAEAAALFMDSKTMVVGVSTHSRAEAAAPYLKKQEKSAY